MIPFFFPPNILSQINSSGGIDGNWFMGIIMAVLGFILVSQIRDVKDEIKDNQEGINQCKTDIAVIKNHLGL